MSGLLWKENALLLVNAVLAGVMVGIGSYGQRYRHHPFTRLIFIGATTLFLPIVSYLVSTTNDDHYYAAHITNSSEPGGHALTAFCFSRFHPFVVSICAFLVQITATNTCVIVAGDEREVLVLFLDTCSSYNYNKETTLLVLLRYWLWEKRQGTWRNNLMGICKLMKHWDGKMNQCSVLGFHRSAPLLVLLTTRLLRLPDQKTKVKVSASVKLKIIDALRSCNSHGRRLSNGTSSLRQSQVRDQSFLWACNGKGTSDIILTWHIATCILEVRYPQLQEQETQSISDNKIVAMHLSRYCAYLMAWYPDLLPDDDGWSKSVYDGIKKDVVRVLASGGGAAAAGSSTPEAKYQKLLAQLMSEPSNHEVLKSGVRLGKQLAELTEGEGGQEAAWKLLAGFWSEMILYVAPSDNLKGHSEAIARGGELITLIWAMLFHAGIVDRPTESGCGIDPAAGVA
ncbi:hypothetical protein QOZ80_7AG0554810 [Eleusine coracana subsp. coracana]|nr:hypothetical protein QOZ80_7AG0554810 [Eleusine coracana subsp. coracana]